MTRRPSASQPRLLREVLQRAFFSPPSLGLTAATVVFLSQPETWLAALVAAGLNAFLLATHARSPRYVRRVAHDLERDHWRACLVRAEELQRVLDPATAGAMGNLVRAQERLLALSAQGEGLVPSHSQAADLMAHCLELAEKRLHLEAFVAESRAGDLEREVERLRGQASAAGDAMARRLFEQALDQKLAEQENLKALQNAIARIDGQLAAVDATFDNLVGKIVRLRTADTAREAHDVRFVLDELHQLTQGVAAVEASLTEMLVVRSA
jgi:hypothetical protein